jgi:hypothetical protein
MELACLVFSYLAKAHAAVRYGAGSGTEKAAHVFVWQWRIEHGFVKRLFWETWHCHGLLPLLAGSIRRSHVFRYLPFEAGCRRLIYYLLVIDNYQLVI